MKVNNCPVCGKDLTIRELWCGHCQLSLHGEFANTWLASLSAEQSEFVRLFVIAQGNIKEMEKRLKISYPTVKNRLAEIIRLIAPDDPVSEGYGDILNDLEQGFVSVEEAVHMIETRRKS